MTELLPSVHPFLFQSIEVVVVVEVHILVTAVPRLAGLGDGCSTRNTDNNLVEPKLYCCGSKCALRAERILPDNQESGSSIRDRWHHRLFHVARSDTCGYVLPEMYRGGEHRLVTSVVECRGLMAYRLYMVS